MEEYNDIIEKLNNESKKFEPTSSNFSRVKNIVFAQNYTNKSNTSYFNLLLNNIMDILKSKLFWGVGTMSILTILFVVPFIGSAFLFSNVSNKEALLPPIQEPSNNVMRDETLNMGTGGSPKQSEPALYAESADTLVQEKMGSSYVPMPTSTGFPGDSDFAEDTKTKQQDRAQLRDANLSIIVDDFQSKYVNLTNEVSASGGYVQSSNVSTYDDYSYGTFVVRVPVEKFDQFVNYVRKLGLKVTSESIGIIDRQNELTQVIKTIEDKQAKIKEFEAKKELNNTEKSDLARLKVEVEKDQTKQESIKQETEFSTVSVYMTSQKDETVNSTWDEVVEGLKWVYNFWTNVILKSLIPIAFCLPVIILVGILVVSIKVMKNRKK